jgi:hypothetical protein
MQTNLPVCAALPVAMLQSEWSAGTSEINVHHAAALLHCETVSLLLSR